MNDTPSSLNRATGEITEDERRFLPIVPEQWQEVCQWIRMRYGGRIGWEDDIIMFDDAKHWCEEELWGGMNLYFDSGSPHPPNFAELTSKVKEYRRFHLRDKEEQLKAQLHAPKGSLKDYLDSIGAESFAHACYLATQKRAKAGMLGKWEDPNSYENWEQDWELAKETYMVRGVGKDLSR